MRNLLKISRVTAGVNIRGFSGCYRALVGSGESRGESCGIPHLAKNERDAPNFLQVDETRSACAPFFQGKAHEDQGTHEASQEIGDVGHPAFVCGKEEKIEL
jgi:hypothetical protein